MTRLSHILCTTFLFLICTTLYAQKKQKTPTFKLIWENEVGITSYRTTIKYYNNLLYIPSNGEETHLPGDSKDGVHVLDAATGHQEALYSIGNFENSEDCNGLGIHENKIFFGNDNGQFACFTTEQKRLWLYQIPENGDGNLENDIEGAPVLEDLNGDGFPDPTFNVESRGLFALDGKTGELLWTFEYHDEEGSYMNSPSAYDINNDGTVDFIIGGKRDKDPRITWDYLNAIYAINGKTGVPLWQYNTQSGIHSSAAILVEKEQVRIVYAESYSDVAFLMPDGKLDKYVNLNELDGGISGLFASPVITSNNVLVIGSSWWGNNDGIWTCPLNDNAFRIEPDGLDTYIAAERKFVKTGRVSATAIEADVFRKSRGKEIIVCTEKGEMVVFNQKGTLISKFKLPAGTECTPFVGDVNGDGLTDIVVACLNGKVYCYETGVKSKKRIGISQFRMDTKNTGVIKLKK